MQNKFGKAMIGLSGLLLTAVGAMAIKIKDDNKKIEATNQGVDNLEALPADASVIDETVQDGVVLPVDPTATTPVSNKTTAPSAAAPVAPQATVTTSAPAPTPAKVVAPAPKATTTASTPAPSKPKSSSSKKSKSS